MLSHKELAELFTYDPASGEVRWKERRLRPGLERIDRGWNTRFLGKIAGRPDRNGHIRISLTGMGIGFGAHRVAWALHYKCAPPEAIDHANGNPADNRIKNLRAASQAENMRNARRRSDNTSGHKGVSWSKQSGKWYAYINCGGRMIPLGLFSDIGEAVEVRRSAAEKMFGLFARHD